MLRLNYQLTNEPSDREAVSSKIKILGKQLEDAICFHVFKDPGLRVKENRRKKRFLYKNISLKVF